MQQTIQSAEGMRRHACVWCIGLWGAAFVLFGGASAMAEPPAFVGQWGSEATCAPEQIAEYSVDAYETMFSYCEIDGISQQGAGEWSIAAQCLYEGARNPITIRLQLSGDHLIETITTADGRDQSNALVRCAE